MALKASTGLRNAMLTTGSLKSQLDLGFIKIYAGTVPADADASLGAATLLSTITANSDGVTGLSMATPAVGGVLQKASEAWGCAANAATGVASFWRFIKTGDTGGASTTDLRLQGLAATSGSELVLTSVNLTSGAPQTIDYFSIALPA